MPFQFKNNLISSFLNWFANLDKNTLKVLINFLFKIRLKYGIMQWSSRGAEFYFGCIRLKWCTKLILKLTHDTIEFMTREKKVEKTSGNNL